jgi:hypothetical protein
MTEVAEGVVIIETIPDSATADIAVPACSLK